MFCVFFRNNQHKHKDKKKREIKKSNEKSSKYYAAQNPNDTEDATAFSKRTLTTNWLKYEEKIYPIDDNEQLCAADFENLLVTPSSVGSHFLFSTERNWENNAEATSQYFKLNILNLARTLGSLPFYVRQGYTTDIFDSAELKEMDTNACQMQLNLRKELSTLAKPKYKPKDQEDTSAEVVDLMQESASITMDDSDELNALLECTVQPIPSLSDVALDCIEIPIVTAPTTTASKDIQQWLDDIFDD